MWVKGMASKVVKQQNGVKDPSEALSEAKKMLKREFGRRMKTARQMLNKLLIGPKLTSNDTAGIQSFIIELEGIFKTAERTRRGRTFSSDETYNEILNKKLPFYVHNWAKKTANDSECESDNEDDDERERLSFKRFTRFLRNSNRVSS